MAHSRVIGWMIVGVLPCSYLSAAEPKAEVKLRDVYPEVEPFETGTLKVSDGHEIYYELCGKRDGAPAMVLHGGPGGGSYPGLRRYHDPAKYLIVLHDQRGAGKSKPYAELKNNNTATLVEDVEKLRQHLKLQKVQIFGGSWGSTLGVAYAEKYPDSVRSLILRGVFLGAKSEVDHFYHGGARPFFPEAYTQLQSLIPQPELMNYPQQLLDILQGTNMDLRKKASYGWAMYEVKIAGLEMSDAYVQELFKDWDPYDFSLIENYYMANKCFLEEGQLLRDANKIAHIPAIIVQGRYDMVCPPITAYRLHRALPKSKLHLVVGGHSASEPAVKSALVEATDSMP
ncbi:MAG: prolyl aminopeptidase [Planctomycetota bacterium]